MTRLADDVRTARKAHRCEVCHDSIEPGTRYRDYRGADDGQAYTYRTHLACSALGCADLRLEGYYDEGFDDCTVAELLEETPLADVLALPEVTALEPVELARVEAFWTRVTAERDARCG